MYAILGVLYGLTRYSFLLRHCVFLLLSLEWQMCGIVWWGLVSFDEWSLFRRQALGFVIACNTCWPLAAEGRCHLQSPCTATHSRFVALKLSHLHVHSSSAAKQTGDNSTRICVLGNGYTLNKLDTSFNGIYMI